MIRADVVGDSGQLTPINGDAIHHSRERLERFCLPSPHARRMQSDAHVLRGKLLDR